MALESEELNIVKCSKRDFDRQKVKPDNYLFFVYDEQVGEDGKPKTKVNLYKGRHLISGQLHDSIQGSTFKVGNVYTLPAGSQPVVQNVGTETDVVLNVGFPVGAESTFRIGEVSTLSAGSQPMVTNTGNEKNVVLNVKIPADKVLKAGTATRLTANANPTIAVRDNPQNDNEGFIDVGVPSSPYTLVEESTLDVTNNDTSLGNIGFAKKLNSADGDWLDDDQIHTKKQILKNDTDAPCFVIATTMVWDLNVTNYFSSSDNILLIPPHGKGIITHTKTPLGRKATGISEVYPTMKTTPKVVYEVLFKNAETTALYDSINNIKTVISGEDLVFNSDGLSGTDMTITLPPTESVAQRPGIDDASNSINKLDAILFPYMFHCIIHFIGNKSTAASIHFYNGKINHHISSGDSILILNPMYWSYTNRLDLLPVFVSSKNGLKEWISKPLEQMVFHVKGSIRGIRIIAGTPADFLRDPNFVMYKFD